ncbi:hypothetical protein BaRGS_00037285, partial [Batillaria attramentaria]
RLVHLEGSALAARSILLSLMQRGELLKPRFDLPRMEEAEALSSVPTYTIRKPLVIFA